MTKLWRNGSLIHCQWEYASVTILEANLAKYKAKNVHILTTKIFHFLEYTLERLAAKQVGEKIMPIARPLALVKLEIT